MTDPLLDILGGGQEPTDDPLLSILNEPPEVPEPISPDTASLGHQQAAAGRDILGQAPESAWTDQFMTTWGDGDIPGARSAPEAYRVLTDNGLSVHTLAPESMDELNSWAENMGLQTYKQHSAVPGGALDPRVNPDRFQETVARYRTIGTALFHDPTAEEVRPLARKATTNFYTALLEPLQQELTQLQAQDSPDPERLQQIQNDIEYAQGQLDEADSPMVQSRLFQRLRWQATVDRRKAWLGGEGDDFDSVSTRLGDGVLDAMVLHMREVPGFEQVHEGVSYSTDPNGRAFDSFFRRNVVRRAKGGLLEGSRDTNSDRILRDIFRGTLVEHRMSLFGIPEEAQRNSTPFTVFAHTNPNLAADITAELGAIGKVGGDPTPENAARIAEIQKQIDENLGPESLSTQYQALGQNEIRTATESLDLMERDLASDLRDGALDIMMGVLAPIGEVISGTGRRADINYGKLVNPETIQNIQTALGAAAITARAQVLGNGVSQKARENTLLPSSKSLFDFEDLKWNAFGTLLWLKSRDGELLTPELQRKYHKDQSVLASTDALLAAELVPPEELVSIQERLRLSDASTRVLAAELGRERLADHEQAMTIGYDDDTVSVARENVRRVAQNPNAKLVDKMKAQYTQSVVLMGNLVRKASVGITSNPGTVTREIFAETAALPFGMAGRSILARNPVTRAVNQAATVDRLAQAQTRILTRAPEAAEQVSEVLRRAVPDAEMQKKRELAASIFDHVAEKARGKAYDMTDKVIMPKKARREFDSALAEAESVFKQLDGSSQAEIFGDVYKLNDEAWKFIRRPDGLRSLLRLYSGKMGRVLVSKKRRKSIDLAGARLSRGLASRVTDDLKNFEFDNIPISPEAITERNVDFVKRVVGVEPAERGRLVREVMDFSVHHSDETKLAMAFSADNRARLSDYLAFRKRLVSDRHQDLSIARGHTRDVDDLADIDEALETFTNQYSRLDELETTLNSRRWDAALDGVGREAALMDADLDELLAFAASRPGETLQIYHLLAEGGETLAEFQTRVANMTPAKKRLARNRVFEEFYDSGGLERAIDVDTAGIPRKIDSARVGALDERLGALSPDLREAVSVYRARKGIDEMIDGVAPEIKRTNPEVWQRIKDYAALEERVLPGKRAGLIADGEGDFVPYLENVLNIADPRTSIGRRKQMRNAANNAVVAYHMRQSEVDRLRQKLTPEEQEVFEIAQRYIREEGNPAVMEKLRQDPKYRDLVQQALPNSDRDANVDAVLRQSDNLRKQMIKWADDRGMLLDGQADQLSKPWSTTLYSMNERARVYPNGKRTDDVHPVHEVPADTFETQRHGSRFTVATNRGGVTKSEYFDTFDEARAYADRRFGIELDEGQGVSGAKEWTGRTATGTRVSIMEPLPEGFDEIAGALKPGAGVSLRMRQTMIHFARVDMWNQIAVPGRALTKAEFEALPLSHRRNFQPLGDVDNPDATRWDYGRASGRYIHKNDYQIVNDWNRGAKMIEDMADILADNELTMRTVLKLGGLGVKSSAQALKSGMITAYLLLSSRAILTNIIGDRVMGMSAFGPGYLFSKQGLESQLLGARRTYQLMTGKTSSVDLPADERLALENNLIDEQMLNNRGFVTDVDIIGEAFSAPGSRKEGRLRTAFNQFRNLAAPRTTNAPDYKKATDRMAQIEEILAADNVDPRLAAKLEVEFESLHRETLRDNKAIFKGMADAHGLFMALLGKGGGLGGRRRIEFLRKAGAFYSAVGNSNRYSAFLYARRRGLSPEEAIRETNDFTQTFSNVPQPLQEFSRTAIGSPLVGFAYEGTRIGMNAAARRPGFVAGMLSVIPMLSASNLAANGIDPDRYLQSQRIESPLDFAKLTTNLNLVSEDLSGVDMPWLNIYSSILNGGPGGINRSFDFWGKHSDTSTVGDLLTQGGRFLSNWAFNGPVVNAGLQLYDRKDMVTGETHADIMDALPATGRNLGQTFIPPWMRGSRKSTQMAADLNRPSNTMTRTNRSILQRTVEALTPFSVKGSDESIIRMILPEAWEDSGIAAAEGVANIARKWFVPGTEATPYQLLKREGWDDDAVLGLALASSSSFNLRGDKIMSVTPGRAQKDIRLGLQLMNEGDPKTRARGEALVKQGEKDLAEHLEAIRRLPGGITREFDSRELRSDANAYLKGVDVEEVFSDAPIAHKAAALALAVRMGIPDEQASRLMDSMIFIEMQSPSGERFPTGDLRQPGALETDVALQVLDQLAPEITDPTLLGKIERNMRYLEGWSRIAAAQEEVRDRMSVKGQKVLEILDSMEGL